LFTICAPMGGGRSLFPDVDAREAGPPRDDRSRLQQGFSAVRLIHIKAPVAQ
jgi:hypothetical protein